MVNGLEEGQHDAKTMTEKNGKKKESPKSVGLLELFSFADKWDIFWMSLGLFAALVAGAIFPLIFIIFGSITTGFTNYIVHSL